MAIKPEEAPTAAPAKVSAGQSSTRRSELDLTKRNVGPVWRQYLRAMGPGLVTGASDDDPSGIATYSQAGAQYGLSFLWTALLTLPLMAAVQEICDRTALATGTGLRELAIKRFNRFGRAVLAVLLVALIVANGLNIAADLVAIGSGMQLLNAGPTWLWALVAGAMIATLLVLGVRLLRPGPVVRCVDRLVDGPAPSGQRIRSGGDRQPPRPVPVPLVALHCRRLIANYVAGILEKYESRNARCQKHISDLDLVVPTGFEPVSPP